MLCGIWHPDPVIVGVNAFTMDWGKFGLCYAFPPFNMVGKVLKQAMFDSADVLVVAQNWPTQYWYPMLVELSVVSPLKLP